MNEEPVCMGKSASKKAGWAKLKADSKALEETLLLCGKCQEERKARDARIKTELHEAYSFGMKDWNQLDAAQQREFREWFFKNLDESFQITNEHWKKSRNGFCWMKVKKALLLLENKEEELK